jgi:hypothetical protein
MASCRLLDVPPEDVQDLLGSVPGAVALIGTRPAPDDRASAPLQPSPPPSPAPPIPQPSRWAAWTGYRAVAAVAIVAAVLAAAYSSERGWFMLYADARSHLTIARRVIDGHNASFVQVGTVWLPGPHLVLLPFVAVSWLWHTGWAAVPVDTACLVVGALSAFDIVVRLTRSRLGGWVAVALLLSNMSVLYLHTTALTEPVLFASMLATVATLVRWATNERAHSGGEMALFCGVPAMVAVLSRYDGWAFVAVAGATVLVVAWQRWGSLRYALHITRCFVTLPLGAALWWLWFNWINWGDPLEFQRGPYSAQAQQAVLAKAGLLPEQGHLGRSLEVYSRTVAQTGGWLIVTLGCAGLVAYAVAHRRSTVTLLPLSLALVPFAFYVLSLVTGQAVIRLGNGTTTSMFNLRYGVLTVLGLVVMAGLGVATVAERFPQLRRPATWRRTVIVGVPFLIVAQLLTAGSPVGAAVVREGLQQKALATDFHAAAVYLHDHAGDGVILIDDSINPVLPVVDADLDRVIAPFSGKTWTRALADLSRADWLYLDEGNPDDDVAAATRNNPAQLAEFRLVFHQGKAAVYHKASS